MKQLKLLRERLFGAKLVKNIQIAKKMLGNDMKSCHIRS